MNFKYFAILAFLSKIEAFISPISNSYYQLSSLSADTKVDRDEKVQQVLELAREIGPIGADAAQEDQDKLESLAKELQTFSDCNPAESALKGFHNLIYSASKGGSSGKLFGPFHGNVKQEFLNDESAFINSVTFGPFKAALQATRSVMNSTTNKVTFHQTKIEVLGQTVVDKQIEGGGVWKYLFMGKIVDKDGKEKLVRVMKTPSLFVLEQDLS